MKIVFFGTPSFAAEILQDLIEHHISIAGIVTQPDRPQGRRLQMTPSQVKSLSVNRIPQLPLFQPEKASDPIFLKQLEDLQADLFVVVAYGQILSRKLLAIPPLGCINVHASLLPKYRGAAPMQRCLMNGDAETGVCIQKMVYELDAGDVIDSAKMTIPSDMTLGDLEQELCNLSKPLLRRVVQKYDQGVPAATPQDASLVTIAPKITPEEMRIHWDQSALHIHNRIRGLSPRPGAWCWIEQGGRKRLKILRSQINSLSGPPGKLLVFQKNDCIVAAQNGSLRLLEVQPEGKKSMSVEQWIRGCQSLPLFEQLKD